MAGGGQKRPEDKMRDVMGAARDRAQREGMLRQAGFRAGSERDLEGLLEGQRVAAGQALPGDEGSMPNREAAMVREIRQGFGGEIPAEAQARERAGYVPEEDEEEGPIGKKALDKARETLNRYRAGKANMDKRIVANEKWWRMQHMPMIRKNIIRETDTPSGWLFNSLANKHADAMDNYPSPSVLPREAGDRMDAEILTQVLPVILEQNDFEQVYDETWQYKLKSGTGCYGVFWNNRKLNGLGDIDIKRVDILNLYWEPRCEDIQESRNLFYVYMEDNDTLVAMYPQLEGKLGGRDFQTAEYAYEDSDSEAAEKSSVIDWYYKKWQGGREVLHFCKFCGNEVLYATENDPALKDSGIYDHGKYPFVLDVMYKVEGSPAGFGYVDIMMGVQTRIDRLQNAITENALETVNNRWWIRDAATINEDEFKDHSNKLVHVAGEVSEENVRQITVQGLNGNYIDVLTSYINELKEISGNRDVNAGGSQSGVTAASAIAALQEAGSKLSRDMIKASYRAFAKVCYLVLENIRQFYTEQRTFRITGADGTNQFVEFSNIRIKGSTRPGMFGMEESRLPIFDVEVKAQQASPYSRISQNELAKEFFQLGFFNPQNTDVSLACLRMMDFEGKQEVIGNIEKNGTMYDRLMQLQQEAAKLAAIVDREHGTTILQGLTQAGLIDPAAAQAVMMPAAAPMAGGNAQPVGAEGTRVRNDTPDMNSLGKILSNTSLMERAKNTARDSTAPR